MKRILSSWPYLGGVLALYFGWVALTKTGGSGEDAANMATLYLGTVVPLLSAGGGVLLGWRRGYDWIVVVVCELAFIALVLAGNPAFTGSALAADAAVAAIVAYTAVAHVGIVAALAVKAMNAPSKKPGQPRR